MIPHRLICFYRLPVSALVFPLRYSRCHGLFCLLKLFFMLCVRFFFDFIELNT
ncbi:unnamed protein product [Meloidogyne enterolobii]|uniref:Uncharacterized protein n=1 Tax=Meloidogyne enterolobii TaxID=390850 RepID=A0ACB0Y520_MELEN